MSELDFGLNAGLVEELFGRYLDNPDSVDASWRSYFDERTGAAARRRAAFAKPGGNGQHAGANGAAAGQELSRALDRAFDASVVASPNDDEQAVLARAAVQARVFQLRGDDAARDRRAPRGDLLPQHRRRVHAHRGPGRAQVAARVAWSRRRTASR
jgi:2-oxoglutarate dehydrogenase complex dehydrogenase (E1) component-like enzyme